MMLQTSLAYMMLMAADTVWAIPPHVVPAPPTGLRCGKATASSVTMQWAAPPIGAAERAAGAIHLYDLEVGLTPAKAVAFPTTSVTVPGTALAATLDELQPGTDYFFKLRAHCGAAGLLGCSGGDGQMISGWSNFSAVVPCTTAAPDDAGAGAGEHGERAAVSRQPAAVVETFWLEAWRVTENMMTFPDYLSNHNSGDLDGDVAFLSHEGGTGRSHFFDFMSSPRVKYCVEIATADFSALNRTSSFPPFLAANTTFSVSGRATTLRGLPRWQRCNQQRPPSLPATTLSSAPAAAAAAAAFLSRWTPFAGEEAATSRRVQRRRDVRDAVKQQPRAK